MAQPAVTPAASEAIRQEVALVLQSELFSRTPALSNLLSYLCEKTLAGEANQLKEYTIAVDVFGRRVDYDQDSDSIVRVEAARLRKRLRQYYETVGQQHPIHIDIPVGQYVPVFQEQATVVPATESVSAPVAAPVGVPFSRRKIVFGVVAALVVILAAAGVFLWQSRGNVTVAPAKTNVNPAPEPASGLPGGEELRIRCGDDRQYIDRSGKIWLRDQYFTGGTEVRSQAAHIWRTPDTELYRSSRQGDFAYDIPLKPGIYELRLHFAETSYGPEEQAGGGEGSRIIGVAANGQPLLSSLDVVSDAGGSRTAVVKIFTGIRPADDGLLHLKFWSTHGGRGMVSAIEVLPGRTRRIRPIRIATRDSAYYSDDSRWWSPDNYFKGGQLAQHNDAVRGANDDTELYGSERYGNFSYAIPVSAGKYTVTLSFVERCGPESTESCIGGTGPRIFNVICNGKVLLREFNLSKESKIREVVEKRFSGIEPNPQGKLMIEFVPLQGYATVTTIEVLPE